MQLWGLFLPAKGSNHNDLARFLKYPKLIYHGGTWTLQGNTRKNKMLKVWSMLSACLLEVPWGDRRGTAPDSGQVIPQSCSRWLGIEMKVAAFEFHGSNIIRHLLELTQESQFMNSVNCLFFPIFKIKYTDKSKSKERDFALESKSKAVRLGT